MLEIEMPESCSSCIIAYYSFDEEMYCPLISTYFNEKNYRDKRRTDCKLRPIMEEVVGDGSSKDK